ncbi:flagellar basal body L-ring protein FlgH [Nitrospinota bacterium]
MRFNKLRSVVSILIAASVAVLVVPVSGAQPTRKDKGGFKPIDLKLKPIESFRSVQSFRRKAARSGEGASRKKDVLASLDEPDNSSLWSDKSPFFFTDKRASKVGDIITVVISESSNAKKEADTDIDRQSSLTFTAPALPGYGEPLGTPSGRARRFDPNDTLRTTSNAGHATETEVERTDTLSATISAKVVEVFPNGNLFIEGRRELTTHKETLIVMLSGIARPEDIDSDNNIQSKFLADAKIVYTGDGILEEAQSPGWLARIVTKLWPF